MNYSLKTTHNKYDDEGNTTGKVDFDKEKQESAGSNKVIDLSGPLFSALLNGTLLVVYFIAETSSTLVDTLPNFKPRSIFKTRRMNYKI
jgi:hypothetical protein